MKTHAVKANGMTVARLLGAGWIVVVLAGCESGRALVAVPFDVAKFVAVKAVEIPYDAAKMTAQGMYNAAAEVGR